MLKWEVPGKIFQKASESGNPQVIAEVVCKIPPVFNELKTLVLKCIDEEMKTMCHRPENSVLRKCDYVGLSS